MRGKYLKLLTQLIHLGPGFLPFAVANRCPTPKRLYRAKTFFTMYRVALSGIQIIPEKTLGLTKGEFILHTGDLRPFALNPSFDLTVSTKCPLPTATLSVHLPSRTCPPRASASSTHSLCNRRMASIEGIGKSSINARRSNE